MTAVLPSFIHRSHTPLRHYSIYYKTPLWPISLNPRPQTDPRKSWRDRIFRRKNGVFRDR